MDELVKRPSIGESIPYAKRIKQEPANYSEREDDDDDGLYNDGPYAESSENSLIQPDDSLSKLKLPGTIDEVFSTIFDLNLNNDAYLNNYAARCKDLSKRVFFEKKEHYKVAYLPYVMVKILKQLNTQAKSPDISRRRFMILIKIVDDQKFIEFKCISPRLYSEDERPKVGEFIAINSVYKNENADEFVSDQTYYGYVLHHYTRWFEDSHQIENTLLKNILQEERKKHLVDEIVFKMKYVSDLHKRNDYILQIKPLGSSHSLIMQAKAILKIDEASVCVDLISPRLSIQASSLLIEPDSPLSELELDVVQKAIDLIGQNDEHSSKILCLDIKSYDLRHTLKVEIIRQVHKIQHLISDQKSCILILSESIPTLEKLYNELKTDERFEKKVSFLGSSCEEEEVKSQIIEKYILRLRDYTKALEENIEETVKKKRQEKAKNIEGYIQYLKGNKTIDQIDFEQIGDLFAFHASMKSHYLINSFIALASISELTESLRFYQVFNPKSSKPKLLCCIVDDASYYDEPEIISLTNFGVNKFILMSQFKERSTSESLLSSFALDRPLFNRFVEHVSAQETTHNSSVVTIS